MAPERWRSPADGVAGLDGLTVKTCCLSGYSHYPPPQLSGSDVGVRERKVSWNRLRPLVSAAICGLASAPLPWVPVAQR